MSERERERKREREKEKRGREEERKKERERERERERSGIKYIGLPSFFFLLLFYFSSSFFLFFLLLSLFLSPLFYSFSLSYYFSPSSSSRRIFRARYCGIVKILCCLGRKFIWRVFRFLWPAGFYGVSHRKKELIFALKTKLHVSVANQEEDFFFYLFLFSSSLRSSQARAKVKLATGK